MGRQWRSLPAVRALRRGVFSLVTVARLGFNLLSLPTHTHTCSNTPAHKNTWTHTHTHTHNLSPSTPTLTPPLHPDFISSLAWQRARRSISTAIIIIPNTVAEESNFHPGKYAYCRGADKSHKKKKKHAKHFCRRHERLVLWHGLLSWKFVWFSQSEAHPQVHIPFFLFPFTYFICLAKKIITELSFEEPLLSFISSR